MCGWFWKNYVGCVTAVGDLMVCVRFWEVDFFLSRGWILHFSRVELYHDSHFRRIWTVGFEIGLISFEERFVCKADKDTSGMRWMRIYSTDGMKQRS